MSSAVTLGILALRADRAPRRRLSRLATVQIASAAAWLVLDRAFELNVLWAFNAAHGVSAGDVFALAPLAIAALLLVRRS
jgi:hypothetical protein